MKVQGTKAEKMLDAKLLAYCAMASGALLAAPPAEAAVVYSGVKSLSASNLLVDLNNDTINDMQFQGYYLDINIKPLNNNAVAAAPLGMLPQALRMPAGDSIDPGLSWT